MSIAVLMVGAVGDGKTRACLELAERCRREGFKVYGVASPRVFLEGGLVGYNCVDLSTRRELPLARLKEMAEGPGWSHLGELRYAFSISGLEWANSVLLSSSKARDPSSIIFVDEFGRLEAEGRGLLPGILHVVERLREGGIAAFTCRSELQASLEEVIGDGGVETLCYRPSEMEEIWRAIQRFVRVHQEQN